MPTVRFRIADSPFSRILLLALLLLSEAFCLSLWLDAGSLAKSGGLAHVIATWGARSVNACVGFVSFLLLFGFSRLRAFRFDFGAGRSWPKYLIAHAITFAGLVFLSDRLFNFRASELAPVWLACGILSVLTAALAAMPAAGWISLGRSLARPILGAAIAAILVAVAAPLSRELWAQGSAATLTVVRFLLIPLVPQLMTDSVAMTVSSPRFAVQIAPECSGYEGIGLMLAFGSAWLFFFRGEYRFPQSLLLLPAGAGAIWILNSVRIAALFLMGHLGFESIALGGFHSQAGWIAFLGTAIAFAVGSRRLAWMHAGGPAECIPAARRPDSTIPFLLPFLTILATGFLTRAFSSSFDYLYPLRFFTGAAALWYFRKDLAELDWRPSWMAVLVGAAVFALWIGIDLVLYPSAPQPLTGLQHLAPEVRVLWLVFRCLAASVTVPIAEELAFRAFLLRRLVSEDVSSVDPRTFRPLAFFVSSVLFGILHGDRWIAGTIAGMLFAYVYQRRGSVGEAALAHGISNALLAAFILSTGSYQYW